MIEPGTPVPGGRATLEDYEHWLACDAILSPPLPDGIGHPMFGYYLALRGMGWSLEELFALMDADASAGVVFGEAQLELAQPLRVGATYSVSGEVVEVERKRGKRAGTFDVLTFRLEVRGDDGVAAVSTNSFVFPRP